MLICHFSWCLINLESRSFEHLKISLYLLHYLLLISTLVITPYKVKTRWSTLIYLFNLLWSSFFTYVDHQSFDLLSLTRINFSDQSNVLLSIFDNPRHLYPNLSKSFKTILLVSFISLPRLFESRDEIPVKWGRIVTPQKF
jgi:hypothetical protein